jgi:probable HAF family extracellular repeat protein
LSAQTKYQIAELPDLGAGSQANSINNRGWVAGGINLPGGVYSEATAWIHGSLVRLGTLGGPNSLVGWPVVNDGGVIAGISETADLDPIESGSSCQYFFPTVPSSGHACRGFRWENNAMTALPTLGGTNSYATGANRRGQIVGWAENTVHDSTCVGSQVLQFHAVIWGPRPGQIQELLPLPGDSTSAATAINDQGDVVGISGDCFIGFGFFSARHAVLWHNGMPTDLGNFGGKAWNTPTGINNQGVIVGFSDRPGDDDGTPNYQAFIWTQATGLQKLPQLPGETRGAAFGINDKNQIVGLTKVPGHPYHATLWENGGVVDLNTVKLPGSPYLIYANAINDAGAFAGQAFDANTGQAVAFVATPVPNP